MSPMVARVIWNFAELLFNYAEYSATTRTRLLPPLVEAPLIRNDQRRYLSSSTLCSTFVLLFSHQHVNILVAFAGEAFTHRLVVARLESETRNLVLVVSQ